MKGVDNTTNLNQHLTTIQVTNMKYITILDFSMGHVHQYEIQEDQYESTESLESFICDKGFNLGNIEWMSHYDKKIY
jgi:hypothetical protein